MTACGKAVCLGLTIVFFLTGVLIAVVIVTKEGGSHQNGQSKESTHNMYIVTSFRQNNNCDNPPKLESGTSGP